MTDVISEYQKWKQQGDNLRAQAKQAMESRFRELLSEAAHIASEYRADFGSSLKPPSSITAFRYKSSTRSKAKKSTLKQGPAGKKIRGSSLPEPPAPKPNRKIAGLQKSLTTAKKMLDDAKATGKPTKALEDRIYEIEDELRLSGHA
jgi:hypothetical protein